MEDDLKKIRNGRRPQKKIKMEDDLKKKFKKNFFQFFLNLGAMEDDLNKIRNAR
jgi:hypothetical protein